MAGFDAAWRTDKVLICSLEGCRVRVWAWLSSSPRPRALEEAIEFARYYRRTTGHPVWIESSNQPAALWEQPRGFTSYR